MDTYAKVLVAGLVLSVLTAMASTVWRTPYGRFAGELRGPRVPIRVGWLLMESTALPVFYLVYANGPAATEPVPLFFLGIWTLHYANRALFFPLAMRVRKGATMGTVVVYSGFVVVPLHAWLYARWVSELGTHLTVSWLTDPRFVVGIALYAAGFVLNVHSDAVLRRLRDARVVDGEDSGYRIPYGGGFRWVSCPHYAGELLAWSGLALATWCPGGLFILTISAANLVPRAAAIHSWYHERFDDYPEERKALVPYVW